MERYDRFVTFDEPIPYRKLLIKPVKVRSYFEFFMSIQCLTIEKNKIPDVRIIQMSYLDFLVDKMKNDKESQAYGNMLLTVMLLCLNVKPESIMYKPNSKGKHELIVTTHEGEEEIINAKDFDIIKDIILKQNIPSYDDAYIDPKVEAALKEAEEFMNKKNKGIGSLEDQIVCVMTGLQESDTEKIYEMTIRKFTKLLQRIDHKLHYQIYKAAEMGGMVTFKESIDHWMSDLSNKNKYGNAIVDYGSFKEKFGNVT